MIHSREKGWSQAERERQQWQGANQGQGKETKVCPRGKHGDQCATCPISPAYSGCINHPMVRMVGLLVGLPHQCVFLCARACEQIQGPRSQDWFRLFGSNLRSKLWLVKNTFQSFYARQVMAQGGAPCQGIYQEIHTNSASTWDSMNILCNIQYTY